MRIAICDDLQTERQKTIETRTFSIQKMIKSIQQ